MRKSPQRQLSAPDFPPLALLSGTAQRPYFADRAFRDLGRPFRQVRSQTTYRKRQLCRDLGENKLRSSILLPILPNFRSLASCVLVLLLPRHLFGKLDFEIVKRIFVNIYR